MRNAATSVPTTMAITNDATTSRTVTQKPEANSPKWSSEEAGERERHCAVARPTGSA